MANPNAPLAPQTVNKFANKANINAAGFNLTTGQTVTLDLDSYISNKTIQVSTFSGGITAQISLDGNVFFPSIAIGAIGIYPFPLPWRYLKLTATGNVSGVVVGSLSGGGSGTGGGGGGDVTSVNGQTGTVNLSTDEIPEGSTNLYYTNARALAEIDSQKGIPNGIASLDSSGHVPTSQLGALTTDEVPEGIVNLYFTAARAQAAAVQNSITSGNTIQAPSEDAVFNALAGKQPSGSYISSLTGDVSATGPGAAAATVNSVGGSSAANIHSAELAANAATNLDTPSTIVKRDASGNIIVGTVTGSLSGNATSATTAGSATNFSGSLVGDVTGTQGATSVQKIRGTSVDATLPSDAQILIYNSSTLEYSPESISNDISISHLGAATVNSVGGSSAANVHSAELAANAATNLDTVSTIVKRDASGNFVASQITANSINIVGTAGAGFIKYSGQSVTPATPVGGTTVFADSANRFSQLNTNGFTTTFDSSGITANRLYTLRDVSGKFLLDSRLSMAATLVNTSPVTILSTDAFAVYLVDTTAARTINLPSASSVSDRVYIFKDISANASANNITIVPNGTDKIEGLNSSFIYSTSSGSLTLLSDASSNWWMI